ncbi:MAG: hypothetical protein KDJ52_24370 [Anaerolineae bacterium]|nr:hypothetical protein [Anaerolineae bacterium]MCB0212501.1 hypothetical protein [Anaerolineae bacterium]
MITNNGKKQNGWAMRLLTAVSDKMFSWSAIHEMEISPQERLMFMNFPSVGWEGAFVYSMTHIKQLPDQEV